MRRVTGLALISLTASMLVACGESEPPATAENTNAPNAATAVATDTYVVRAVITQLPTDNNPAAGFMAHHEAIPDFRGQDGAVGMHEMTMGFPLAEGLDLSGFSAGEKVAITFTVDYDTAADRLLGFRVTSLEHLPEGTTLNFESPATPE